MKCEELLKALNDYVDGLLAPAEVRRLEEHLEGCDECRARIDALRGLGARLAALPREVRPRRDLRPRIEERVSGAGTAEADAASADATGR